MDEETFNEKLRELITEISGPPKEKQKQLAPLKEIKASADKVTKSLSDLRICLKYIMFDLEATRRERDQLKVMLQDKEDDDDDPDYPPKY